MSGRRRACSESQSTVWRLKRRADPDLSGALERLRRKRVGLAITSKSGGATVDRRERLVLTVLFHQPLLTYLQLPFEACTCPTPAVILLLTASELRKPPIVAARYLA